jgi:hypothetical protein
MENETVIRLGKAKSWLIIIPSVVLIGGSIFLCIIAHRMQSFGYVRMHVILLGISGIVIFGSTAIVGIVKLRKEVPGIIINSQGINIVGAQLIQWEDIVDYSTAKESGAAILLLYVDNPVKYIDAAKGFRKIEMKVSMQVYKTPFSISAAPYQCTFDELKTAILERMKQAAIARKGNA